MKGETRTINGDRWTIVDVAPAAPLAEMVAALLEEEGFVVMTRGAEGVEDVFSHLGAAGVGTTLVLVPEADAARAMELISETVTDFEGEELEAVLREAGAGLGPEELAELGIEIEWDDDEEGPSEAGDAQGEG